MFICICRPIVLPFGVIKNDDDDDDDVDDKLTTRIQQYPLCWTSYTQTFYTSVKGHKNP